MSAKTSMPIRWLRDEAVAGRRVDRDARGARSMPCARERRRRRAAPSRPAPASPSGWPTGAGRRWRRGSPPVSVRSSWVPSVPEVISERRIAFVRAALRAADLPRIGVPIDRHRRASAVAVVALAHDALAPGRLAGVAVGAPSGRRRGPRPPGSSSGRRSRTTTVSPAAGARRRASPGGWSGPRTRPRRTGRNPAPRWSSASKSQSQTTVVRSGPLRDEAVDQQVVRVDREEAPSARARSSRSVARPAA